MKIIIIQIVILVMFPFLGHSQSEFSIYGGGGLSGLHYKTTAGNAAIGSGGQYGLGYRYFFGQSFGVGMNVGFARYRTDFNAENINLAYRAKDIEDIEFDFRSSVHSYKEKQDIAFLQIPLMMQYNIGNYYIAGGVKAGIPLSGKYSNSATTLKNSGYYVEEEYEYTTQRFMGFGTFNDISSEGNLDFKTVFFITLESGFEVKLGDIPSFYFGFYLDYGLNNTINKKSLKLVEYNTASPADFTLNSVANSYYAQNKPIADKISPFAFGVKITFALGFGK